MKFMRNYSTVGLAFLIIAFVTGCGGERSGGSGGSETYTLERLGSGLDT